MDVGSKLLQQQRDMCTDQHLVCQPHLASDCLIALQSFKTVMAAIASHRAGQKVQLTLQRC